MSGLDLFSGIGGIGLALRKWVRTVAYCEQDRFCQSVLLSRMRDGDIDFSPIWDDVRTLESRMLPDKIDIIFGGFPCQDISVAGNRVGLEGERSGLFYEIVRLTKEIYPPFVFLENVPGIRTRGLRQVVGAFTKMGYDCRWTCISASSVGAPHKRERWFFLANSYGQPIRDTKKSGKESPAKPIDNGKDGAVAYPEGHRDFRNLRNLYTKDAKKEGQKIEHKDGADEPDNASKLPASFSNSDGIRLETKRKSRGTEEKDPESCGPSLQRDWSTEPNVDRVVDGLPHRVDRIKALGNSVVPAQVEKAFLTLLGEYRVQE